MLSAPVQLGAVVRGRSQTMTDSERTGSGSTRRHNPKSEFLIGKWPAVGMTELPCGKGVPFKATLTACPGVRDDDGRAFGTQNAPLRLLDGQERSSYLPGLGAYASLWAVGSSPTGYAALVPCPAHPQLLVMARGLSELGCPTPSPLSIPRSHSTAGTSPAMNAWVITTGPRVPASGFSPVSITRVQVPWGGISYCWPVHRQCMMSPRSAE